MHFFIKNRCMWQILCLLLYKCTKNTNWGPLLIVGFLSNQFDYEKHIGNIGSKKESNTQKIFTVSIFYFGPTGTSGVSWAIMGPVDANMSNHQLVKPRKERDKSWYRHITWWFNLLEFLTCLNLFKWFWAFSRTFFVYFDLGRVFLYLIDGHSSPLL